MLLNVVPGRVAASRRRLPWEEGTAGVPTDAGASGGLTGGRGLPENHRALVVPYFCISHLQRGFGGRLRSPRKSLNNAGVLDWSRYESLAVQFNLQRWLYS